MDSYREILGQIERGAPWVAIRNGDFAPPGLGLALLAIAALPLAAGLGRPLRGAWLAVSWAAFLLFVLFAVAGWWTGADQLRERAARAGYEACSELERYGRREVGKYWARTPQACPPRNSGSSPV